MMSWFEVLKDFKTDWKDPETGKSNPNVLGVYDPDEQSVHINLGANALKNVSEEEAITLITDTLTHEYTHMGFNQIAGTVEKYYEELIMLLNKFHGDVLDAQKALPLPEEEIIDIVQKIVGHKLVDELNATRSNLKDGPSRVLIEGYHKDSSRKFGILLKKYINSMKTKTTELASKLSNDLSGSPAKQRGLRAYLDFVKNLSLGTLEFLDTKLEGIIKLYELYYKNVIAKLSSQELKNNPDLTNQYIRTMRKIAKDGNWHLLEEFWDKEV